mmetsp:Transcript_6788/g.11705  ORF Transcript_6788/g.11705 Transcript_6788/m.11705 type:complete len:261 (+) Transcript_6788:714-1496(+)
MAGSLHVQVQAFVTKRRLFADEYEHLRLQRLQLVQPLSRHCRLEVVHEHTRRAGVQISSVSHGEIRGAVHHAIVHQTCDEVLPHPVAKPTVMQLVRRRFQISPLVPARLVCKRRGENQTCHATETASIFGEDIRAIAHSQAQALRDAEMLHHLVDHIPQLILGDGEQLRRHLRGVVLVSWQVDVVHAKVFQQFRVRSGAHEKPLEAAAVVKPDVVTSQEGRLVRISAHRHVNRPILGVHLHDLALHPHAQGNRVHLATLL